MPVSLQLVVFDMAGTTVFDDHYVERAFRDALSAEGVAASSDAINAVMGYPKPVAARRLLEQEGDAVAAALDARAATVHADFLERINVFYASDPAVRAVEGATSVFETLKADGLYVALNTGFSRSTAAIILDRLGWSGSPLIDATVTSDEVEQGRPAPDMIEHLMQRTGVTDAAAVAKVGDTPSDLQEGTRAGCSVVVGVAGATHSREALAAYPHTHLIDDLTELPSLLRAPAAPHG